MKRNLNRIISTVLSLSLCASMAATSVSAAEVAELDLTPSTEHLAASHVHNQDGWQCTQSGEQKVLTCTLEEHTHTSVCYPAQEVPGATETPEAPVTTPVVTETPVETPAVTEMPVETPAVSETPAAPPAVTETPAAPPAVSETPAESPATSEAPVATPDVPAGEPVEIPENAPDATAFSFLSKGVGSYVATGLPTAAEPVCGLEEHTHTDACYTVTEGEWTCAYMEDQAALDKAAVEAFLDLVSQIPEPSQITLEDAALIAAARAAYESLTGEQLVLLQEMEGKGRSALTAIGKVKLAEEALARLGSDGKTELYKNIMLWFAKLKKQPVFTKSGYEDTFEASLKEAIGQLNDSEFISATNKTLFDWERTAVLDKDGYLQPGSNSAKSEARLLVDIIDTIFEKSSSYEYRAEEPAVLRAGRELVSTFGDKYFVYCSERSLEFPRITGLGFKAVTIPSNWDTNCKDQLARALMAGYPLDVYGLSQIDNFSDDESALMTQSVIWSIIEKEAPLEYGNVPFVKFLYDYAMSGSVDSLPEGYRTRLDKTVSVTASTLDKLNFDVERGYYSGEIRLTANTDLSEGLAKSLVRVDRIPAGLTVVQNGEVLKVGDFIDLKQPLLLTSAEQYAAQNLGALKFKYVASHSIDPGSFSLFQTYRLFYSDGAKPYQRMIGYLMKDDGAEVSVQVSTGARPDPVAPIDPTPEEPVIPTPPPTPVVPTPPTETTTPGNPGNGGNEDTGDVTPPAPQPNQPETELPENPTPLNPAPDTAAPETDVEDQQIPLAPAPEEEIADPQVPLSPAVPEDEVIILEEDVPLGDLPQTGTAVQHGSERLLLALSALALVGYGVCMAVAKRREEN